MFSFDEKVVYPGHGVATISRIIEKEFGGKKASFYELVFIGKGATILVPTHCAGDSIIRPLSPESKVDEALKVLSEPAKKILNSEFTASNWNKRIKEYQLKLRRLWKIWDLSAHVFKIIN